MTRCTEGGWMWWIAKVRETTGRSDVSELLKLYIAGVKWEDVK